MKKPWKVYEDVDDLGFLVSQKYNEVYSFWWPGTYLFRENGLCLESSDGVGSVVKAHHFKDVTNKLRFSGRTKKECINWLMSEYFEHFL